MLLTICDASFSTSHSMPGATKMNFHNNLMSTNINNNNQSSIETFITFINKYLSPLPQVENPTFHIKRSQYLHAALRLYQVYGEHIPNFYAECRKNAMRLSGITGLDLSSVQKVIYANEHGDDLAILKSYVMNTDLSTESIFTDRGLIMLWGLFRFGLMDLHNSAKKYCIVFSRIYRQNVFPNDTILHMTPTTDVIFRLINKYTLEQLERLSRYCLGSGIHVKYACALRDDMEFVASVCGGSTKVMVTAVGKLPIYECKTMIDVSHYIEKFWRDLIGANDLTLMKRIIFDACSIQFRGHQALWCWAYDRFISEFFENPARQLIVCRRLAELAADSRGDHRYSFNGFLKLLYIINDEEKHVPKVSNSVALYSKVGDKLFQVNSFDGKPLKDMTVSQIIHLTFSPAFISKSPEVEISISEREFNIVSKEYDHCTGCVIFPHLLICHDRGSRIVLPEFEKIDISLQNHPTIADEKPIDWEVIHYL